MNDETVDKIEGQLTALSGSLSRIPTAAECHILELWQLCRETREQAELAIDSKEAQKVWQSRYKRVSKKLQMLRDVVSDERKRVLELWPKIEA